MTARQAATQKLLGNGFHPARCISQNIIKIIPSPPDVRHSGCKMEKGLVRTARLNLYPTCSSTVRVTGGHGPYGFEVFSMLALDGISPRGDRLSSWLKPIVWSSRPFFAVQPESNRASKQIHHHLPQAQASTGGTLKLTGGTSGSKGTASFASLIIKLLSAAAIGSNKRPSKVVSGRTTTARHQDLIPTCSAEERPPCSKIMQGNGQPERPGSQIQ
ncbi:hypothetical protein QBC35DRAFT_471325 [Podospora australis]|uniref:Uncharacterized protein n=1 Tax=Podospora australis TaxID=1536484 RepID=A0AAN6X136_9PEZI|nr:hypothetical protein QBC35DRAFT_471325 [Podospora australis]